jgi:hypothetical protein
MIVEPGERAAVDAEAVGADMLHRRHVPDFDGARHRPFAVVGVGGVEEAVDHDGAVEVEDRTAVDLFPDADALAGHLVVFGDQQLSTT